MRHLAGRFLHSLLLLLGVSVLSFLFSELAPGDYLDEMRLDPRISEESVQATRARLGLDRPLPVRYVEWLRSVVAGEFGYSMSRGTAVGPLLWERARNTLFLAGTATAAAWLAAIPLGLWSAARRGGWLDRAGQTGTSLLLAVPDLLLGLLCLIVAARIGWLPVGGMVSPGFEGLGPGAQLADLGRHLLLPAAALALASLPVLWRHVRSAVVEVLDAPFLRAARGQGVAESRLLYRHALRAAANPLISLFGLSLAGLLSGSLLIEEILSWPGLGPLLLDAIRARDVHLVIGALLLSCVFLIGGNLVADVLLYWLDPRVRRES